MADEFVMPKLGLTMESGTIVSWLVADGDVVGPGQPLLVIETDKVESEVESTGAGVMHRTGEVGQEYACGDGIGWILADGETPPASPAAVGTASPAAPSASTSAPAAPPASSAPAQSAAMTANGSATRATLATTGVGGRLLASPNAKRLAAERGIDLWAVAGTGPGGRITSEDVPLSAPRELQRELQPQPQPSAVPHAPAARSAALATAAGRNLADLLGIDIAEVRPTGVDPRITKEDVAAHVRALLAGDLAETAQPTSTLPRFQPLGQDPSDIIPLTGMRGTIAERMSDSLRSMAQLTLNMDVDMDGVVADRARRKADGAAPGYTDYVIAAAAAALQSNPIVNSQITNEGVALLPTVNVGLAVALDGGLIVPVIHNTPSLDLNGLAAETTRLAAAARDGKLKLPELEGGTFSVTALGMFDVDGFTPIINAPNTAILGVGRLREDLAWSADGAPVKTTRLTLSLSWDHRAFDGAPAAEFARTVKHNLERY